MALQNADALAGAQVPNTDSTLHRGREELQQTDVWMELHQTKQSVIIIVLKGLGYISRHVIVEFLANVLLHAAQSTDFVIHYLLNNTGGAF